MVLSVERFWMAACIVALFMTTYVMLLGGDLEGANQQISIGRAFWEFFLGLGDYDPDTRGAYYNVQ